MGCGKTWTQDDKQFLADKWGTLSIRTIALRLNRTETAVNIMKNRMELGRFLEAGDYISLNTLYGVLKGSRNLNTYQRRSWIENRQCPVHTKRIGSNSFKIVYLDEFWTWAEKHQYFLDFSNFEENMLGKEPAWVKEKRRRDFRKSKTYKRTPWTTLEDEKLLKLLKEFKYTNLQLSQILSRTEGAIQRRIHDLGYKERPVKADNHIKWEADEINVMNQMILQGHSYETISEEIGKSVKAIRGKVFRMYQTESLDHVRKELKGGKK